PCCSDQEIQRLHPGVTGTLCHHIKQLPVRLGMQLVKDHSVDIEAILSIGSIRTAFSGTAAASSIRSSKSIASLKIFLFAPLAFNRNQLLRKFSVSNACACLRAVPFHWHAVINAFPHLHGIGDPRIKYPDL